MLQRFDFTGPGRWLLAAAIAVTFLTPAWGQDPAARVIEMVGRVSMLRDSTPWALNLGSIVMPGQIVETGVDGYAKFSVSDGSTFEVFPKSRVVFRANRTNWQDLLDLYLGQVKVYIQKLNGQPNNNRVTTPTAVISVRGTIFHVVIEDQDDTTLVSVDEGEVGVRNRVRGGEVSLHPGESVRVFKNQPLAQRRVDKADVAYQAARTALQAIYDLVLRRQPGIPGGSGGTIPTTTTGSGDHDKGTSTGGTGGTTTPAPAPAPPPAAPPPAP